MQVAFSHGAYHDRPALHGHAILFGDLLPIDAQMHASFAASLEAFYNALRQAAAGDRQSMVASAIASFTSSAGNGAAAAYKASLAAGKSEAEAKAAAQAMVQVYQAQEAAYRNAAASVAAEEEARRATVISDKARKARALLDQGFDIGGYDDPKPPASGVMIPMLLAAAGLYLAMKG